MCFDFAKKKFLQQRFDLRREGLRKCRMVCRRQVHTVDRCYMRHGLERVPERYAVTLTHRTVGLRQTSRAGS